MIYAPVCIATLCRDTHFVRGIESLKKNGWAKYTDVYIALDYPAKDAHWPGYIKIKEYLEGGDFSVFKSFQVVKRDINYGVGNNSVQLIEDIAQKYDRWIYAEDDLEFSPNFLEYMDKCLMKYENDPTVMGINGYSYPIPWVLCDCATAFMQSGTYSTWGIGNWREKYYSRKNVLQQDYLLNQFQPALKAKKLQSMIAGRKYDYIYHALTGGQRELYTKCTDIACGIYMSLNGQCVITPRISKVRNWGFDGSGVYCERITTVNNRHSQAYDYENQPIDESDDFELIVDELKREQNLQKLDAFLYVPRNMRLRCGLLMLGYRMMGQRNTIRFVNWVKTVMHNGNANKESV